MKIIQLILIFIEFLNLVSAAGKDSPEYNQSLLSFDSPIREIIYRWEYTEFGKRFDRKTGQLLTDKPTYEDGGMRGSVKVINGFCTSVGVEKIFYPNNTAQQEFKKLVDKLNTDILPETLLTSKIIPFLLDGSGKRLVENTRELPEINTEDDLRDFITESNVANETRLKNKRNLKDFHFKIDDKEFENDINNENENLLRNNLNYINVKQNVLVDEDKCKLINSCKDAYELVNVLNQLGGLTSAELELVSKKAVQMVSSDMKQNSVLLLTMSEFGMDTRVFLDKLSSIEFENNKHIILRSLSESKIKLEDYSDQMIEKINKLYDEYFNEFERDDLMRGVDEKEKYMELYNYICSYCKFITKKVVSNLSHINKIESYIKGCRAGGVDALEKFTVQQLVDICYHLGLVNSECCKIVIENLHEGNCYSKIHYSELINMFTKASSFDENNRFENVERLLLELYKSEDFRLELEECMNALVAIGRSRKCGIILIDRVVEDVKKYTNELELEHIVKVLINLSKVNYNNRGFVRHMANLVLTFIDEDSILDAFTISDLMKSLGRFHYYNEKLMKTLFTIMGKEEVLAEFQVHDLVTVFTALSKMCASNSVNTTKLNLRRHMRMMSSKIISSDINTEMAIRLINASGRMLYTNERFLNTLIESINLDEVNDLSRLYKLKINADKLSLHYPELTRRIESLERKLRPKKDETIETEESEEGKEQDCEENDFERTIYVRRRVMYGNLKLPSVRKRKWTY